MEICNKNKPLLDDDILKAIEGVSFLKESLMKCREGNHELNKQIIALNNENKKITELENNHRESLGSSKQLISEQQFTISKLVSIKEDLKQYKDDIANRERRINELQEEKIKIVSGHENIIVKIKNEKVSELESVKREYEAKIEDLKNQLTVAISEGICNARQFNEDALRTQAEQEERINVLVLEYEEQLQRAHAQVVRLRDEQIMQAERSTANTAVYVKRIAELEQKQNQRTVAVAPHQYRSNSPILVPNKSHSSFNSAYDDRQTPQNNPGSAFKNQPPSKGQFKIQSKNATNRMTKPLKTQCSNRESLLTTPRGDNSSSAEINPPKSVKRKLFSKHNDDFYEADNA